MGFDKTEFSEAADLHRRVTHEHLEAFAHDLRGALAAIDRLQTQPLADEGHFYIEAIRTASRVRQEASARCDSIAFAAHASPARLSIPRLAKAMGISVNTLRARLPRLNGDRGSVPFDAF